MSEQKIRSQKSKGFANVRTPMDKGTPYDCPELKRNPGMCDSRFEAFYLPSLINGQLVEPKRKP